MILEVEERNVRMSGGFENEAVDFSIDAEDFGFISGILSDRLYSNKILAVVREYLCNAVDSNNENGSASNVLISPPSSLSPVFKVRDFGAGLSFDDVTKVYIKFGKSTKRGSNDSVGTFGLGAKSAFSYTDSFSIVSFYEGKRYLYTAQKNREGKLQLIPVCESPSAEPSGIEISIPVQDHDIQRFNAELAEFCKYLAVPLDFNGAFTVPALDKVCDFDEFFIERTDRYSQRLCKVLMGGVTYPIDSSQLKDSFRYSKNIVIRAKIGDVDVAPDREKLEYTKKTVDFLSESFAGIKEKVLADFQKKIDACRYPWEVVKLIKDSNDSLGSIIHSHLSDYTFKGRKFEDNKEGVKYYNYLNGKFFRHRAYLTCHNISDKTVFVVAQEDSHIIPSRLSAGITEKFGFTPSMIIVSDSQDVFDKLFCSYWNPNQIVRDYKSLWAKVGKTGTRPINPNVWVYRNKSRHGYIRVKDVVDNKFYVSYVGRFLSATDEDEKLCSIARNLEIEFYGINRVHVKKLDSSWNHLKVAVEAALQKSLKDFDAKKYYISKAIKEIGMQHDIKNMIACFKDDFGPEDRKAIDAFNSLTKTASDSYVSEADSMIAFMKENGVEVKIGEHKDVDVQINAVKSFADKYMLILQIYNNCGWRANNLMAEIKKFISERTI